MGYGLQSTGSGPDFDVFISTSAPTEAQGLVVGALWSDKTAALLKRCTAVGPVVFVSVESGAGETAAITFVINGGSSTITTGEKGDLEVPFACTITAARIVADASGSIVVDIWKDTFSNFPPINADSITASAPPTLSSADNAEDATLTGWTKSIAAGDWLRYNVDSATTVKQVTVTLTVTVT